MNPTRDPSQPDPALPGEPMSAVSVAPVDLAAVLEALRVSLVQAIRYPVIVGVPDGRQPGIYICRGGSLSTTPCALRSHPGQAPADHRGHRSGRWSISSCWWSRRRARSGSHCSTAHWMRYMTRPC